MFIYDDKKPYWQLVYRGAYQPANQQPEFFPVDKRINSAADGFRSKCSAIGFLAE